MKCKLNGAFKTNTHFTFVRPSREVPEAPRKKRKNDSNNKKKEATDKKHMNTERH